MQLEVVAPLPCPLDRFIGNYIQKRVKERELAALSPQGTPGVSLFSGSFVVSNI